MSDEDTAMSDSGFKTLCALAQVTITKMGDVPPG